MIPFNCTIFWNVRNKARVQEEIASICLFNYNMLFVKILEPRVFISNNKNNIYIAQVVLSLSFCSLFIQPVPCSQFMNEHYATINAHTNQEGVVNAHRPLCISCYIFSYLMIQLTATWLEFYAIPMIIT